MAGLLFNFGKLEPLEKLKKARIKIQQNNSFFGYMSLYLKFQEVDDNFMEMPCGVDNDGNFYYKKSWIDKLSDDETSGLEIHEILHLCLTGDSLVLTSEGFKPIKEVKKGDKVYSHQGLFTEVVETSERDYKGEIFTIKSLGTPCSFTPEHPILTKKIDFRRGLGFKKSLEHSYKHSRPKTEFLKAGELKKNDALIFPIPNKNEITKEVRRICALRNTYKKEKIWLDKDTAYFIGYFVGNGSLHKVKKKGQWLKHEGKSERNICLTMHEKFDTKRLENIVKNKLYRSPYLFNIKDKKAKRIIFSCYGVAKFLRNNFYKNNKKSIPNWMLYEKDEIIESFIEGLFDSDGHKEGNLKTISSSYQGVYSFIPLLLLRLGYTSFSMTMNKGFQNKMTSEGLRNKSDSYAIGWRIDRKNNYSKMINNKMFHPIKDIQKSHYEGKVYNLETKAHTFCCPYFITHNCLMHLSRRRNRDPDTWNLAADLVVNSIALKNGFRLPDGGMIPVNDEFTIGGKTIRDISTKTSEMVYDELPIQKGKNSTDGKKSGKGFDKHIEPKAMTEKERKDNEDKWIERIESAAAGALMKGDLPKGMASMLKKLHRSQVNWRTLLLRYVQSHIPFDYSYCKPSKKSVSAGYYMPNYLKEKIKVLVAVDMSGSIGDKEVSDFMSEVVGLARAYQDRIEMTLLTHDIDVHDEYKVENGVAEKLMKLKLHGGGGTSHKLILDKIDKKYKDTKIVIFLTDGCSDLEDIKLDKYRFDKLFVISKGGYNNLKLKGRHKIIKLDE